MLNSMPEHSITLNLDTASRWTSRPELSTRVSGSVKHLTNSQFTRKAPSTGAMSAQTSAVVDYYYYYDYYYDYYNYYDYYDYYDYYYYYDIIVYKCTDMGTPRVRYLESHSLIYFISRHPGFVYHFLQI